MNTPITSLATPPQIEPPTLSSIILRDFVLHMTWKDTVCMPLSAAFRIAFSRYSNSCFFSTQTYSNSTKGDSINLSEKKTHEAQCPSQASLEPERERPAALHLMCPVSGQVTPATKGQGAQCGSNLEMGLVKARVSRLLPSHPVAWPGCTAASHISWI